MNDAKSKVSTQSAGNKASQRSIRSFEDCMPDINLALILVIDNSGLDQQKDFLIVNIFIEANN